MLMYVFISTTSLFDTALRQGKLISNYRNPLLFKLIYNVCYKGTGSLTSTHRSFVQGLKSSVKKYSMPADGMAFISTIPDEIIALGAAAVSFFCSY
jgi:hypothetical protein